MVHISTFRNGRYITCGVEAALGGPTGVDSRHLWNLGTWKNSARITNVNTMNTGVQIVVHHSLHLNQCVEYVGTNIKGGELNNVNGV